MELKHRKSEGAGLFVSDALLWYGMQITQKILPKRKMVLPSFSERLVQFSL